MAILLEKGEPIVRSEGVVGPFNEASPRIDNHHMNTVALRVNRTPPFTAPLDKMRIFPFKGIPHPYSLIPNSTPLPLRFLQPRSP